MVSPIAEEAVLGFLERDDLRDTRDTPSRWAIGRRFLNGHITILRNGCHPASAVFTVGVCRVYGRRVPMP